MNQSWDEMFTPFIQYTIDDQDLRAPTARPQKPNGSAAVDPPEARREQALSIAEVVGCLEPDSSGAWTLTSASDPILSRSQSTSAAAVKAAAERPPGNQRDQLLGVGVFNPSDQKRHRVVVKGVLIKGPGGNRLNVTSLQSIAQTCF
jgi:hypothetical protein